MSTIQPRGSLDDGDDAYPYTNPSPQINKPTYVTSTSGKRFLSEYGTDNEVERVAVQNLSANSIKAAQV